MYRAKPKDDCEMPAPDTKLKVVVLNASLKHEPDLSNTEEVANLVVEKMEEHGTILQALRCGDLSAVERHLSAHLWRFYDQLAPMFEKPSLSNLDTTV